MNFVMLPKYYISKTYTVHRQYLLTKPAKLVFCTECSKAQVATSSMIN